MRQETRIVLFADEGKTLTNGETQGKCVWLSPTDSPENWTEIDDPEEEIIL